MTNLIRHPAFAQVITVANALGDLRSRVVFIGGAIAPLLHQEALLLEPRPTSDVDGVLVTSSYLETSRIQTVLRARGFRHAADKGGHAFKWIAPGGISFDLVPVGNQLGASGSEWDAFAIATAVETLIGPDLAIKHASAVAFLMLKWAAYQDRGKDYPLMSHDLEDILALLAARPTIHSELIDAPEKVRRYAALRAAEICAEPDLADLLPALLNNAKSPRKAVERVLVMLTEMGGLSK